MGFFLTVEGGEGSGKSTLVDKIYQYLQKHDVRSVIKTYEPGATLVGAHIRSLLLHQGDVDISKRAELLLFLADRAHHVDTVIKPALQQNKIVICDRFTDSSLAYQGVARVNDNLHLVEMVCNFAADNVTPDLTLYLDLDPEVGLKRLKRGKDRLENLGIEFHKKVRDGYLNIAKNNKERIFIIDAQFHSEVVFEQAISVLKNKLASCLL